MKRYCLALDLVDNPELIAEYERWHTAENGWPEITKSIKDAGITDMQIYRTGNRLLMILETTDEYVAEEKAAMDAANPKVQAWEAMMGQWQQPLPGSVPGEKWKLMTKVFELQQP